MLPHIQYYKFCLFPLFQNNRTAKSAFNPEQPALISCRQLNTMALAQFFSSSLSLCEVSVEMVIDNAHTHPPKPSAPAPVVRKAKVCRWDSSLSKRESMAPSPGSRQRSTDPLLHHQSQDQKGGPNLNESRREMRLDFPVIKLSAHFDTLWAETSSFPESARDAKEPPRMPHRNGDYFPEADEREQFAHSYHEHKRNMLF